WRNLLHAAAPVPDRLAAGESPDIPVEAAEFLLDLQKRPGIENGGANFEAIPDDSRVLQESPNLGGVVARYFARIEVVVSLAVISPLLENRRPAQARLRTLENQEFKQLAVIVDRHAPFPVMVPLIKQAAVGGPSATAFQS